MNIHKPNGNVPWKRIIKEHLLDVIIGIFIGIWIGGDFTKIADAIHSMGGLTIVTTSIVSIGALIMRIYGKNGNDK